ncbi:type II toxin-antitoxin system Phd/YefM family antitoxin [Pseudomonas citronellolis]|nr:type II toxin-antitoxin system Phd/YefM family antitoxin [Pseudomonas citronellolis]TGC29403.1 type II toxin-antitoxin system Phd/YefM family antitoxin [Pseudomonas citronellolis]
MWEASETLFGAWSERACSTIVQPSPIGSTAMSTRRQHTAHAVSLTQLKRTLDARLREVAAQKHEKLVVVRGRTPMAVILDVESYQALLDELYDLRLENLTHDRLAGFEPGRAIRHEDLVESFSDR